MIAKNLFLIIATASAAFGTTIAPPSTTASAASTTTTIPQSKGLPSVQVPDFPQDKCPASFLSDVNYAKYLQCVNKTARAIPDGCPFDEGDAWPACSCDAHKGFVDCIEESGVCPAGVQVYEEKLVRVCVEKGKGLPAVMVPGFEEAKCPKTFFEDENYGVFVGCANKGMRALEALDGECRKADAEFGYGGWPECSCDAHKVFGKCVEEAGICPEGIRAYNEMATCGAVLTATRVGYAATTVGDYYVSGVKRREVGVGAVVAVGVGAIAGWMV
ncbi:hypothetical protein HDU97_004960 [Phlyctochytrium planicorne]|nr:hypothetical protein HDU97_004960 [Phlyctochytrium planicorne]